MAGSGTKQKPEYTEGKPCRKCGSTKKILVWRIRSRQRNNIRYYKEDDIIENFGTADRIRTTRCWRCFEYYKWIISFHQI